MECSGGEPSFGKHCIIGVQVGEDAHPEGSVGHPGSDAGGFHAAQPFPNRGIRGQQSCKGGIFVGEAAVLHSQRCQCRGDLPGSGIRIGEGDAAREGDGFLEPPRKERAG